MADKSQNNDTFEDLCAGYVLDALDSDERRIFEEMLKNADESQQQLFRKLQSTANQLAFTVQGEAPAPALKQQLMKQIHPVDKNMASADKESHTNRFALAVAASFALFIITVALIFYAFNLFNSINDKERIIANQQTTIAELKTEIRQKEELLAILSARTVDLVVLTGMEVNTNGYGKIIWDPETERALLQVSNLPPEPPGKDYQLWLIKNNTPMPAGVFSVNTTDEASFFKVEEIPDVTQQTASAFAVTLEPAGGMPQPTGDMYLMGSMK